MAQGHQCVKIEPTTNATNLALVVGSIFIRENDMGGNDKEMMSVK